MNFIILTGGTSKRFGKDKSQAMLNGRTLLEFATEGLSNLIVVGPKSNVEASYISESPEFGGPVAGIAAGMNLVDSEIVGIFAVDMPFAPRLIRELEVALVNDAALPLDRDGFAQPLAALYRSAALRRALSEFELLQNQSMKSLVAKLQVDLVKVSNPDLLKDIDTESDLAEAIDLASRLSQ